MVPRTRQPQAKAVVAYSIGQRREACVNMRIFPIQRSRDASAAIKAAVFVLKHGGVIAFPTETVYGLGCDPSSASAVQRLYRIKGRSEKKPLQLIASSLFQVRRIAKVNPFERKIASIYWPGPLTLLLQVRSGAPLDQHTVEGGRIGIRVTSDPWLHKLLRAYGKPIAATSANRSGKPTARAGEEVEQIFQRGIAPELLIDVGRLAVRRPSTVAHVDEDGTTTVFRQGAIRLPKRVKLVSS